MQRHDPERRGPASRMLAGAVLAACTLATSGAAVSQSLDEARLVQWLEGYEAAWETKDAQAAARLFTADARYYETPYADAFVGRSGIAAYWSDVTSAQRDIDFESEIVAIDGDVGVARWHATFTTGPDDARVELDGVFVLEFDAAGSCRELREWWHSR